MTQPFENASELGKEFIDTSLKSAAAFSQGAQAIAAETTEYARRTVEAGTSALRRIQESKTAEKAIDVQAEYARTAYEDFVAQAAKTSELYADLLKGVWMPFESVAAKSR